ncbi:MAG: hypothetical protein KAT58_07770, partial [candidate division Zixibacteria bacterium]|nr:hypothetical protein [candidate division Zixibacteria bacterium]
MRNKALLLLLGLLIVALFWALATASGTNKTVTAIPVEGAPAAQAPSERAPCAMTKTTGVIANYFGGFEAGMIVITYFNPAVHCTAPIYPFEITDFSFTLYDDGSFIWPAMVDIVVYGLAVPGDSCGGPGAELCRYSLAADQLTYEYPNVGTY